MPPLPQEIKMLIDTLIAQIQQLQKSNDDLRGYVQIEVEKAKVAAAAVADQVKREVNERVDNVYDDMKSIHSEIREIKDVKLVELQKALAQSQNESTSRIIKVQATMLVILATGIVGVFFTFFHH